ncbi:MAG: MAPEG family protein [Pseudomonadota bacterium]
MSVQMVLLPVFMLVLLAFGLMFYMGVVRRRALVNRQTTFKDTALSNANWPDDAQKAGNCFSNQFEMPVLFYALVALALPLRQTDLIMVLLAWVFVVTRYAHAYVFLTSNHVPTRFNAYFAGVLVLLAMWVYFALRILLVI